VWSECLRHIERKQDQTDPLYSIAGLKDLLHLPVCRDHEVLQHHLLAGQSADDWQRSLWDFAEDGAGWGKGLDVKCKRNLLRAFEAWVDFQCVFKGIRFREILAPVTELFRDQGRVLEEYGAEFVWAQLEWMIREYRYEVVTTRGRTSRRQGAHLIVNQEDCVQFLLVLVRELVQEARDGRWEPYPHPRFYAPGSRFNLVRTPDRSGGAQGARDVGMDHVARDKGKGGEDRSHKHGVCMWFVAGQLQMMNRKTGVPFRCRDGARKHAALKTIPIGIMRKLLQDPDFVSCRSEGIKRDLIQKVEEKKHLFAK
jgi:hypothetical protein